MRQVTIPAGSDRRCAGLVALLAAFVLSACYPDLDWKELRSAEGRFKVLMPARWETTTGKGPDGITQVRYMAQTRNALFGVGYADYPDSAATHLIPTRESLLRNAKGQLSEDRELHGPAMKGRQLSLSGSAADGSPRELNVRLIARDKRLYQLAVVSKPGSLSVAELDTFFLSFEPSN